MCACGGGTGLIRRRGRVKGRYRAKHQTPFVASFGSDGRRRGKKGSPDRHRVASAGGQGTLKGNPNRKR